MGVCETQQRVDVVLVDAESCETTTRPFWTMRAVMVAPVVSMTAYARIRLVAPLARLIGSW